MSKHGGSESLGLEPAGLQSAPLAPGSSVILEAPVSQEIRERQARKLNFERPRVALEVIDSTVKRVPPSDLSESERADWEKVEARQVEYITDLALKIADALIAKTGGEL